jgi:hypothetical protein
MRTNSITHHYYSHSPINRSLTVSFPVSDNYLHLAFLRQKATRNCARNLNTRNLYLWSVTFCCQASILMQPGTQKQRDIAEGGLAVNGWGCISFLLPKLPMRCVCVVASIVHHLWRSYVFVNFYVVLLWKSTFIYSCSDESTNFSLSYKNNSKLMKSCVCVCESARAVRSPPRPQ